MKVDISASGARDKVIAEVDAQFKAQRPAEDSPERATHWPAMVTVRDYMRGLVAKAGPEDQVKIKGSIDVTCEITKPKPVEPKKGEKEAPAGKPEAPAPK